MTKRYAAKTSVPIQQSRNEIESLLVRYGGTAFAYAQESGRVIIGFRIASSTGRSVAVKMELPLPSPDDHRESELPQLQRCAWRSLVLIVKAKLEACHSEISTIEREFMADLVMPDGRTLTEHMGDQINHMLENNIKTPLLLTGSVR